MSLFLVESNILLEKKKQSITSTTMHGNLRKDGVVNRYILMGDKGVVEM